MEIEAAEHIVPSPTLRPAQRIQIYNQQYWWRLLNILHDIYPMLTRLFGYYDFNRTIAVPYLTKCPPRHWSLNLLGDRLVGWLEEDYHAEDKDLVIDAARIDFAFNDSFLAGELPPLAEDLNPDGGGMDEVLEKPLFLQPHIHLFKMKHHLFDFRNELLEKEPEYWLENDFPLLKKEKSYYFVLYRNGVNDISWKEISAGEHHLLELFHKGISVDNACQWLEKQDGELSEAAMENLQQWFQEWAQRGWLSLRGSSVE
jgi:hypothetical protein